jgi:hypothetical protein
MFAITAYFVPGMISSTGVFQSLVQNARSFEDWAQNTEIANYFRRIRKIAKSNHYLHHDCPSIHMQQPRFPLEEFSWNLIFEYFF